MCILFNQQTVDWIVVCTRLTVMDFRNEDVSVANNAIDEHRWMNELCMVYEHRDAVAWLNGNGNRNGMSSCMVCMCVYIAWMGTSPIFRQLGH